MQPEQESELDTDSWPYTANQIYLFYNKFVITVSLLKLKYRELEKRVKRNKIFFTLEYKKH